MKRQPESNWYRFWRWYVDGFTDEPFWWAIGTTIVIGIFIGGIKCAITA